MFGLGKRSGVKEMKDLLSKVQAQLLQEGLGQEMRVYQNVFVEKTKTFTIYGESFASEGMSAAGGLAKYCFNAIEKTLEPINDGLAPMPLFIDLAEKMTYVALTIDRIVPDEDLKDKDKVMIREAAKIAHVWLCHEKRTEYLKKFESLLEKISEDFKADGVVKALQNGESYVKRLTAW